MNTRKFRSIIGIMAATNEGVIGVNNALPWDYPEELAHYRRTTKDQSIIMGQRTYEGMPKYILADSAHPIVLSDDHNFVANDATVVYSLDDCVNYVNQELPTNSQVFMVGGAETAHSFLEKNLLTAFFLTKIHKLYSGDTYLNLRYFDNWSQQALMTCNDYTIYYLENPTHQLMEKER